VLRGRTTESGVTATATGTDSSSNWGEAGVVIILMGVSGAGKTMVGRILATAVGYQFYDADDFHPPANTDKMSRGIPLDDADRQPWLETLGALVRRCLAEDTDAVLACSALKKAYRRYLLIDPHVRLVYLKADQYLIRERLLQRRGHFMHPTLFESQFATLEEPQDALWVTAALSPKDLVATIRRQLQI
jgi:gluconokinase